MGTLVRSFSKINLGLAIGPARPDGFHGLTTLYQTLEAHDLVTVEARPSARTAIVLTSNDARVPTDGRNTAWKMAEKALAALGIAAEVRIHIEKRLPVQGGLGAGSANAAAALLGLERELEGQGISGLSGAEQLRLAAEVGSDVPLFLVGGTVLGLGRGEEVYPMPDLPVTECVVALPEVGVSTPEAFRDWDALEAASSLTPAGPSDKLKTLSRALAAALRGPHSSGVFPLEEDLAGKSGASFEVNDPLSALVRTGIENDFEEVVFPKYPFLGEIKRVLASASRPEHAALYAALSGSGSALFGLYGSAEAADAAVERLTAVGVRSLRTKTLQRKSGR